MVHEATRLNGRLEVKEMPITATVWRLESYKFTIHLIPIIISHPSLLLALGSSLSCRLLTTDERQKRHQA
jgi:hypothetical protein